MNAKPKVTLPNQTPVMNQLRDIKVALLSLDNQVTDPRITLPTFFTVISQIGAISSLIRNLPDKTVTVRANVIGLDSVRALDDEIDQLRDKTITVTTKRVTIGPASMTGSIVSGGAMAGKLVTGPSLVEVGERGYDEAIIPLQLPLSRVDPSVRELAALLRGEGFKTLKPGPTKIINQYMTVNTVAQDPVAVATQVVNRSAMLAHN
jgi:hypothetical protein